MWLRIGGALEDRTKNRTEVRWRRKRIQQTDAPGALEEHPKSNRCAGGESIIQDTAGGDPKTANNEDHGHGRLTSGKLDEKLRVALHSYMEERGINESLFPFLQSWLHVRDQVKLIWWFQSIGTFISQEKPLKDAPKS